MANAFLTCTGTFWPAYLHCIQCKFGTADTLPQGKGKHFPLSQVMQQQSQWVYSNLHHWSQWHWSEQPGTSHASLYFSNNLAHSCYLLYFSPPSFAFPIQRAQKGESRKASTWMNGSGGTCHSAAWSNGLSWPYWWGYMHKEAKKPQKLQVLTFCDH